MKYTNDFRKDAIKYVDNHPELTIKEVAGYLGIPKDTLYGWTRTETRNRLFGEGASSQPGPMSETEKELARLKRENRDLEDSLNVLKKAISILGD